MGKLYTISYILPSLSLLNYFLQDPYTIKHETTAGGEVYTMVEKKPKTKKKGKDNLASMYQVQ